MIAEALEQLRLPESSPGNNVNAAQVKLLRCICGELGQEIDDFSLNSHGVRLGAQPPQLSKNPLKCYTAGNESRSLNTVARNSLTFATSLGTP